MVKILHFADAHIDMANYGRHDAQTGLPLRVMDFLKSLDTIVDAAVQEKVDMVIFAGDAYKDRNPAPTFQREWDKRIMRLAHAEIPTLLLVGNHDLSPALGRAHAIEEFSTLEVPHIYVIDKPVFLGPMELEGLPLQVLALPWVSRSGLIASLGISSSDTGKVYEEIETRFSQLVKIWLEEKVDPTLPTVLTAHASVQGAKYGGERSVMLGNDLVLPGSLVRDPRLDYVALGHIHKAQNLNEGSDLSVPLHPPVIYPGSIERVDFGEAADEKYYVIAHVERGKTRVEWRKLTGIRPFVDCFVRLKSPDQVSDQLRAVLPSPEQLEGAVIRLIIEYPHQWEALIDETALRTYCGAAFGFHLVRRPQIESRIRLPEDQSVGSLTSIELLNLYWNANHIDPTVSDGLNKVAAEIISDVLQEQGI
jgi:DNA repair protein SbcD/Mre11